MSPCTTTIENPPIHFDVELLLDDFNFLCSSTLNLVAPIRVKSDKPKLEPWFNMAIRTLRQDCRKRKWKRDKLQASYGIFRESLSVYQNSVKEAKQHLPLRFNY